jgi:hypothetical protein
MSTFGDDAADRLRGLDPGATAWLAAELRNLATPLHAYVVAGDVDARPEACVALAALRLLADRLADDEQVREELAHIYRDPESALRAMAKRGVW